MRPLAVVLALSLLGPVVLSGCFWNQNAPGDAANDFLRGAMPRMIIEIDFQPGKEPRGSAVDLLRQRIDERCNKPDGVTVDQRAIPVSGDIWTVDELRALEREHRDHRPGAGTAALYIMYLGGRYEQERVLGVTYGPSSFAIFKDTMEAAANPIGVPLVFTATDIERSVIVHEFGHVLGLVNLGTKMVSPHEDSANRGHSNNKDSVMYWAIESNAIADIFTGVPPTQFDANDIADLRAAGGK